MNTEARTNQKPVAALAHDEVSIALKAVARLLEYPEPDFDRRLQEARRALRGLGVGGSKSAFERFCESISTLSPDEREELYTTAFDVTPACVPYVSIHLFGEENFKRGEFMAALHARYQQIGFDCRGELPDHVAVLLRLAAIASEEEHRELTQFCLLGPLAKMVAALGSENPYRLLLETVIAVLRAAYPGMDPAPSPLEQMQRHGGGCPTMTAGCGCGTASDEDQPPSSSLVSFVTKVQPLVPHFQPNQ